MRSKSALQCVILSSPGQFSYNCFESWRKHKAIELYYPELVSEQKPKVEWTLVSDHH